MVTHGGTISREKAKSRAKLSKDQEPIAPLAIEKSSLQRAIASAHGALAKKQRPDGHWVYELEADATIPSEYVLLEHFLDRIDDEKQARIGTYLRRTQAEHGGWPLYHGGAFDISCSVKAYFALKAIGDDIEAPHMRRAREAIRAHGGGGIGQCFRALSNGAFRGGALACYARDAH